MHADDDPPQRRPSAALDRPPRPPVGPRRPRKVSNMTTDQPAPPLASADSTSSYADAAVQAQPPGSPPKSSPGTFIAPPPLMLPPAVSFDPIPIPWKGLPLEAAQWSFSSSELQEIVSKAIRLSARDSFVRLLSLQTLEVDIVQESERLEAERLAAQARWRFEVGRRTMLMQALNACAAFSGSEEGAQPILGFVSQLASAIASCDSLLSTVLSIAEQQAQIALVQHQHWASALGIALRKLNKAHERQGQDLKRAQARVQTLEDELEEAWHEARKMAIEFDDLEDEIAESETSELPEDVLDPHPDPSPNRDLDETGTVGDMTIHTDIAVVLGVTATAVASKATLITSPLATSTPIPNPFDASDTKSVKSTRSRRSTRDGQSHLARLTSARMRSRAASNASLRLPRALRSTPSTHTSPTDAPPMPALPSTNTNAQCDSFLDLDNVSSEHVRQVPPKRLPQPTLALPTPPHSAGLPPTHVPSIWLESDSDKAMPLNSLDRSNSLQVFPSLTLRKMRRSELVMSLTGSDRSSDGGSGTPASGSRLGSAGSSVENQIQVGFSNGVEAGTRTRTETASPTLNHSPVSLPTHALSHLRGPSASLSHGASVGVDKGGERGVATTTTTTIMRPGSAGARLTTTREDKARTPSVGSPRRSLVSRASSVILRRLSQATIGSTRTGGASGSPSRSRRKDRGEANRLGNGVGECEGEVMLIGSPHPDVSDTP